MPTLAEQQQEGQAALARAAAAVSLAAWSSVDPADLARSVPALREALEAVLVMYGRGASTAAADYYRLARAAAGVRGRVSITPVRDISATSLDRLVVDAVSAQMDLTAGRDALDAGAEALVLARGRRQVMSAVEQDREAKGWARIPHEGACSFCLMLAARGAVYGSRASASFQAHHRQTNGSGGECRCGVEPLWQGAYEPPARVRAAQRLWKDSTHGRTGGDARAAFRQAVEGRPVTGLAGAKSPGKPFGKTRESQAHDLAVLEALPPAKTPEAAAWRAARIAEIRKYLG